MLSVTSEIFDLDLKPMLVHSMQLLIAFLLVFPIGFNRESSKHSMGLRTFPLVSLASCCFTLLGFEIGGDDDGAMGEVLGGIITGIGFVGGGAILQKNGIVEGTSTAAAIWAAGCVGVAVAMGRLEIAVLVSLFTFLIFYSFVAVNLRLQVVDIRQLLNAISFARLISLYSMSYIPQLS